MCGTPYPHFFCEPLYYSFVHSQLSFIQIGCSGLMAHHQNRRRGKFPCMAFLVREACLEHQIGGRGVGSRFYACFHVVAV